MRRSVPIPMHVLALLLCALPLFAAEPATRPAPDIEALVAQLGGDDWQARQKAQDGLVAMGQPVVGRLQRLVRETRDEEVRTRAETALKQIEANDTSGPTLVTLHLKDAPSQIAITELARQAKIPIALWPGSMNNRADKVTIDVERQPFWLVLLQICDQTQLSIETNYRRGQITLMQRGAKAGSSGAPRIMDGPFLVTLNSAHRSHQLDYARPDEVQNTFNLQLAVYVDPKARVLHGPTQLNVNAIQDDKGNSLLLPGANSDHLSGGNFNQTWLWNLSVPIKYLPDGGRRIGMLRGSAKFRVVRKMDVWEIKDPLKAQNLERPIPNGKAILVGVQEQGNNYIVNVVIEQQKRLFNLNPGRSNSMYDYSSLSRSIKLLDANDKAWDSGGGGGGGGPDRLSYNFHFYSSNPQERPGRPAKVIWELPTEIKEIEIPVEFKDFPVP